MTILKTVWSSNANACLRSPYGFDLLVKRAGVHLKCKCGEDLLALGAEVLYCEQHGDVPVPVGPSLLFWTEFKNEAVERWLSLLFPPLQLVLTASQVREEVQQARIDAFGERSVRHYRQARSSSQY